MQEKATKAKPGAFPGQRRCAEPGCEAAGEYRAPRARPEAAADGPPDWRYYCLDHVREFNARWNFFAGMSSEEIWAAQSPAAGWNNHATRAFARNATAGLDGVDDLHGLFRELGTSRRAGRSLSAADRRALAALGLAEGASLAEVKAKYRKLARRYHPDANQGDRRHEARFRALTEAYRHLTERRGFEGR